MTQAAPRWRPIGQILVEAGAITDDDLHAALAEQQQSGKRLGEVLIDTGRISWLALAEAIAEQSSDLEVPRDEAVVHAPPTTQSAPESTDARTLETLLRERQRAFMELVSTAESLRAKVARLEEELSTASAELSHLRVATGAPLT